MTSVQADAPCCTSILAAASLDCCICSIAPASSTISVRCHAVEEKLTTCQPCGSVAIKDAKQPPANESEAVCSSSIHKAKAQNMLQPGCSTTLQLLTSYGVQRLPNNNWLSHSEHCKAATSGIL